MTNDMIYREDALNALSHGEGCGSVCSRAILRIPGAEQKMWHITDEEDPPKGEPLIVTVAAQWKEWREVLAPVYYVYDMSLARFVFYSLADREVIGPNGVKVVAWMRMPEACEAPVIWGEKDNEGVF